MENYSLSEEAKTIFTNLCEDIKKGTRPEPGNRFTRLPLNLDRRFTFIEMERLIRRNAKCPDWGERLCKAFDFLYKLGADLLKPVCERKEWQSICLNDEEFSSLKGIHAALHILERFGYRKVSKGNFQLRDGQGSTESEIVGVLAELLLAKGDIQAFVGGEHALQSDICKLMPVEFQPIRKISQDIPTSTSTEIESVTSGKSSSQPDSLTRVEKRCRHCDFINLSEADLCISCAEPLIAKALERSRDDSLGNIDEDSINCPHCTFVNKTETTVCIMCSKTLRPFSEESREDVLNDLRGPSSDHLKIAREVVFKSISPGPIDTIFAPSPGIPVLGEQTCPMCTFLNPKYSIICEMCSFSFVETSGEETSRMRKVRNPGYEYKDHDSQSRRRHLPDSLMHTTLDVLGSTNPLLKPRELSSTQISGFLKDNGHQRKTQGHNKYKWSGLLCPNCSDVMEEDRQIKDIHTCPRCSNQFCKDCSKPYKTCRWSSCPVERHSHHSRMCFFYLRSCSEGKLQCLLRNHGCRFDTYYHWVRRDDTRMRQHHIISRMVYCEYLAWIIKAYSLDPAEVLGKYELADIIEKEFDKDVITWRETEESLRRYVETRIPLQ